MKYVLMGRRIKFSLILGYIIVTSADNTSKNRENVCQNLFWFICPVRIWVIFIVVFLLWPQDHDDIACSVCHCSMNKTLLIWNMSVDQFCSLLVTLQLSLSVAEHIHSVYSDVLASNSDMYVHGRVRTAARDTTHSLVLPHT